MRRNDPFDRTSLGASLGVHLGVLALVLWSSARARPPMEFVSYQIEVVSLPGGALAEVSTPAQEELVVERPEPPPPQVEEQRAPVVEDKPKPPTTRPTPRSDPTTEVAEEARRGTTTNPDADTASAGGLGINVRLEGLRRDYPAYYDNIIAQILRCFRWQGQGNWETTVYFVIHREGTVSDLDVLKPSGNPTFDIEAMGAVECAGRGRFGSLPEDLRWDVLPVQFRFSPKSLIGGPLPDAGSTRTGEKATR